MVSHEDFAEAIALPWLGVIEASGPDAITFLQGQLTNDARLLADGRTQLAAFNTPQGRVIALLRLRQVGETVYLLLPADLVETVIARLKKFVLRAKVQLSNANATVLGVSVAAPRPSSTGPVFDFAPGRRVVAAPGTIAGTLGSGTDADRHRWVAEDIRAGLPQVFAVTSATFIPQMLNLDLLDGISFTKGCYTGQEIVARTQHLGRIKRRALRYRIALGEPPSPLQGLLLDGAKVGEVLMVAPADAGIEVLAVTTLEARDRPLVLEDGRVAEPLPLPYRV